ncbi:MAG TPA: cytochrome c3 family protein [Thermodesulfobacteriota bacterium]|nr:cytochrome c3 family protein [Thermodesulfobacteriota bacterium]
MTATNESGEEVSMYVDAEKYAGSIHGDFECETCHLDIEEVPHENDLQKVNCRMCHDSAFEEEYQTSIHAEAKKGGTEEAASCADCHGKHDIVLIDDPASRVHPLNLAATCAACHADPKITKKHHTPIANPLEAYKKSVHGIAVLSEKNFNAATCSSCHGSHDIRDMGDPKSSIYWTNVPATCGQCHGEIYEQYTESVHWIAAEEGVHQSPVCTDCHGEHEVRAAEDPASPVHPLRVSSETCERCHGSELISKRYGIAEARVKTFEDSYHGLAVKGGQVSAANCASCHGIHMILPSSDPRSMIYPGNLQQTCGSCHKKATANYAKGPVHLTTSTTPGRVVEIVKNIYIGLIVIIIAGMLIHNGADFVRRSKRKVRQRGTK